MDTSDFLLAGKDDCLLVVTLLVRLETVLCLATNAAIATARIVLSLLLSRSGGMQTAASFEKIVK